MSSLTLRVRLMVLVAAAAALTLAALTLGFNLMLRSNLHADANRVLEARASAALEGISVKSGALSVKETPDRGVPDSQVWIYSGVRAIERAPGSASVQRLADSLASNRASYAEDPAADIRLHAVPVGPSADRAGTVVAALSLDPYEDSAQRALTASLVFVGVALLLVVLAARIIVNRALRPVALMTAEAAEWSEHDLEHRFNVGEPRDELTQLAATFDRMLARLASSLRHEQLLSAELSHELRTPLSAIVTEAELALRHGRGGDEYEDALRNIALRAAQMQETLETLMAAARAETQAQRGTASAREVGEQATTACGALAEESGVDLTLDAGDPALRVDVDSATAVRIVAPLVENACRYGRRAALVTVRAAGDAVLFVVEDDGQGLSENELERVFEPGFRGDAALTQDHGGAGLGLALARRLARAVGGDVEAAQNGSGARFQARIPQPHGG